MITSKRTVTILRGAIGILVVAYSFAAYIEFHPSSLSNEAQQYQRVVWDTISGFSIGFALQKMCWILGNGVGVLGVTLLFSRIFYGLPCLIASAPLLVIATLLGESPAAYPPLESTTATLLWCLTSAVWGATVAYVFVRRDLLFRGRSPQN
jgi:hypothetical protein